MAVAAAVRTLLGVAVATVVVVAVAAVVIAVILVSEAVAVAAVVGVVVVVVVARAVISGTSHKTIAHKRQQFHWCTLASQPQAQLPFPPATSAN